MIVVDVGFTVALRNMAVIRDNPPGLVWWAFSFRLS